MIRAVFEVHGRGLWFQERLLSGRVVACLHRSDGPFRTPFVRVPTRSGHVGSYKVTLRRAVTRGGYEGGYEGASQRVVELVGVTEVARLGPSSGM